jgi:hypothetical protein
MAPGYAAGRQSKASGNRPPEQIADDRRPSAMEDLMTSRNPLTHLTRYLVVAALTVGAVLAASTPALAMAPVPPDPESVPYTLPVPTPVPLATSMSLTQIILVALGSAVVTVTLIQAARWARSHRPGHVVRPA